MCNRFALHSPLSLLQDEFGFGNAPEHEAHFNIAPTSRVLAVRLGAAHVTEAVVMRWGLEAPWSPDRAPLVNARAESAADKPVFREAFLQRRALVLADGFFEWRAEGHGRQPYYLTLADEAPFGIGAIYEAPEGEGPATCVLLTVEANALVRPIHDRMPLIVPPEARAAWLDPATPLERLAEICAPYPPERMAFRAVDRAVNDVRHEGRGLLDPPRQGSLF